MTALSPRSSRPVHFTADVVRVLMDDGSLDEQHDPRLSKEEQLHLYRYMVETRQLDERFIQLQRQGRIGFHVGSLGEEAAIIGSASALRPDDWIFPCYREFGAALMRGFPLQKLVDNVFGNQNDTVKGRQMPHHYTCRAVGLASVSSPVGTQMTHAIGYAWAAKLDQRDTVTIAYFGDGATSSSDFHSAMNFAGVFRIPCVFLCRNNGWAISTPTERQSASRTYAEKAQAYGIPGIRVDGNDVLAVVAVTRRAVARAAAGLGPTLIEAVTYRMGGHTTSDDPNRYRGTEDMEPWRQLDPLQRFKEHLMAQGNWDEACQLDLVSDIDRRFREAVTNAESANPPPLESMFDDVYEKLPWHLIEQRAELLAGPRAPSSH
ncbi:MAG TPA: pyruvate dehydrogenase (acetyl-transferring) E1 component subunit alpha [Polyangiaceae bacterium]